MTGTLIPNPAPCEELVLRAGVRRSYTFRCLFLTGLMTFDDLIATYGTGFALNRLNELRLAATGINPTKKERKQLAGLIEYARMRGRVGRVANLLIIGLMDQ